MRVARVAALLAVAGCSGAVTGPGEPFLLEVRSPRNASVRVGDSLRFVAVVVDAGGDTLDVPVSWRTPDTTIVVREGSGWVIGRTVGTGRVQAQVDSLVSPLLAVTVTAP